MLPIKVIVTNESILKLKYGRGYDVSIKPAIEALIKADKARGIDTKFVAVDNVNDMQQFKSQPVTQASSPSQNKRAVDSICKAVTPAYVCLLGSVDVIPHQDLTNPMSEDGDSEVPSDLPYACDHAYSKDIADFLSPTRVVGRLPDLTGGSDVSYLTGLIQTVSQAQSLSPDEFSNYFGITAKEWEQSTQLSLKHVFGHSSLLQVVPSTAPPWGKLISHVPHFINCHGAAASPCFYGQSGSDYPIAHDATQLKGLKLGTVASVECCYGAELYNPDLAGGQPGICNTYLALGAYAFWGSSTIAYGPVDSNGLADLICQSFLKHVLTGVSTGEASLKARLDYIRGLFFADPTDLKTIAQFNLIGDPSLFPVSTIRPKGVFIKSSSLNSPGETESLDERHTADWQAQRRRLVEIGQVIGRITPSIILSSKKQTESYVRSVLESELERQKAKVVEVSSYDVQDSKPFVSKSKAFTKTNSLSKVHIAIGELSEVEAPFKRLLVIVAKQQDNHLVIKYVHSK